MTEKRSKFVRSGARTLEVLRTLNVLNGANMNKVAAVTGLPRGTTYRILETLVAEGYAVNDPTDRKYHVTALVKALGDGYEEEAWVRTIAMPALQALGAEVKWPLGLSTLYGTQLLVRETTDKSSVLALKRYASGHRLSLLTTASGRAFMAFTNETTREALLDVLRQSDDPKNALAHNQGAFQQILTAIRNKGYATSSTPVEGESAIAVPIMARNGILGTLALRYIDSALSVSQVSRRFFTPLVETADKIATSFSESAVPHP